MRFDAGGYKRHSACRLLDLGRRCESGGAGWRSGWERVRSGADRGQRRRGRRGRIGRRWGFGMGNVRKGLWWRRFWGWTTLVRSIDVGGHCYEDLLYWTIVRKELSRPGRGQHARTSILGFRELHGDVGSRCFGSTPVKHHCLIFPI